jgi:hypothetical protein
LVAAICLLALGVELTAVGLWADRKTSEERFAGLGSRIAQS